MSVLESSNLRDLLRVKDDDDGRDALAGLTLAAVLGCESLPKRPSRTLLEIIKDEESGAAYKGLMPPSTDGAGNKKTWKAFRNRLRVRRTGVAFSSSSSSNPVNACDFIVDECDLRISNPVLIERRGVSVNSLFSPGNLNGVSVSGSNTSSVGQANTLRPEGEETGSSSVTEQRPARAMGLSSNQDSDGQRSGSGMELNSVGTPAEQRPTMENAAISREDEENEANVTGAGTAEVTAAPPRVSLMALLEETDWNAGEIAEALDMETDEADEGLGDENDEEGGNEGGEYVCCVCMVRHKGAAFIPCGHTFCRLCSRELWVNRGNCPLCNGYILEILDIF